MAKNRKEMAERMATLHKLRNNIVKAVRQVDIPETEEFSNVRKAVEDLKTFEKEC